MFMLCKYFLFISVTVIYQLANFVFLLTILIKKDWGKKVLNVNKCFVYNVCVATLVVYPHLASLKNIPGHGGIRTYDLWNAFPVWIYTQSSKTYIIFT